MLIIVIFLNSQQIIEFARQTIFIFSSSAPLTRLIYMLWSCGFRLSLAGRRDWAPILLRVMPCIPMQITMRPSRPLPGSIQDIPDRRHARIQGGGPPLFAFLKRLKVGKLLYNPPVRRQKIRHDLLFSRLDRIRP